MDMKKTSGSLKTPEIHRERQYGETLICIRHNRKDNLYEVFINGHLYFTQMSYANVLHKLQHTLPAFEFKM